MTKFWLGASLTVFVGIVNSLHVILTLDSWCLRLRTFHHWLPVNVCLAALSGFLFELVSSDSNEFGRGLLLFTIIVLVYLIAYSMEFNLFVFKTVWDNADTCKSKDLAKWIYLLGWLMAVSPFFVLSDMTAAGIEVGILVCIWLGIVWGFYGKFWTWLDDRMSNEVKTRIERHLTLFCKRSFAAFDSGEEFTIMRKADRAELSVFHRSVNKSLEHVYMHRAVENGEVVPWLDNKVLGPKRIKMISADVEKDFLLKLTATSEMLTVLLGKKADADASYDVVVRLRGRDIADELYKRRATL